MIPKSASHLPQFSCVVHQDQDEPLNCVCMNTQCAQCGLLCRLCNIDSHSGHKVISFKKLTAELANCQFDQSGKQVTDKSQQDNKEFLANTVEHIRSTKQRIVKSFEALEEMINQRYAKNILDIEKLSTKLLKSRNFEDSQLIASDSLAKANEKVVNMVRVISGRTKTVPSVIHPLTQFEESLKKKKDEFLERLRSLTQGVEKEHKAMIALLRGTPLAEEIRLSTTDKHTDIIVEGSVATRNQQTKGLCACVTAQQQLVGTGTVYGMRIRMLMPNNFIKIGIANQSILRDKKFCQFGWRNKGHGHYLITNSQDSFAHTQQSSNSSLKFGKDDVINVRFDSKQMLLVFSKDKQAYTMKIEQPSEGDCYRFVVYLHQKGDSVELLPSTS